MPENLPALRRSDEGAMLAGVCAGVARSLGVEAKIVRIITVVLAIAFGGLGAALYLAGLLLMPKEGETYGPLASAIPALRAWPKGSLAAVVVAAAAAATWAIGSWTAFVPLAVIAVVLWFGVFRRRDRPIQRQLPAPSEFDRAAQSWRLRLAEEQVAGFEPANTGLWQQPYTDPGDQLVNDDPLPEVPAGTTPNWRLWGVALTLIGLSTGAIALTGLVFGLATPPLAYLSAALGSLGITLLVAARRSRRPPLLVPAAIVTAIALLTQLFPVTGSIGDVTKVITDPSQLPSQIMVAAGDVNLDLSQLKLTKDTTVVIKVDAGDVTVQMPQVNASSINWHLKAGESKLGNQGQHGLDLSGTETFGASSGPALHIELTQGFGNLEVRQ